MAEQSGFFDAHLIDGEYDRIYLAASFAKYFASFIGNGVFSGKSSELIVRQKSSPDMSVKVMPGQGWINGYWYENTSELSLAIDIADGVSNRIDLIVLRWSSSERVIRLAVKKGVPAVTAVAPTIQRNADIYELELARISIKAGTTSITQVNITDMRLDSSVCGYVHGVVDQLSTEEFGAQLNSFIEQFIQDNEEWFTKFKADSDSDIQSFLNTNQQKVDKLISDGTTNINNVVSTGQTNIAGVVSTGTTNINKVASDGTAAINKLISDKTTEVNQVISNSQSKFNKLDTDSQAWFADFKTSSEAEVADLIEQLEGLINTNDLSALNLKLTEITSRVVTLESKVLTLENDSVNLKKDVTALKALGFESTIYKGCFCRLVNNEVEWLNAPNEPGIEYKTIERWNNKPVYQKLFYVGACQIKHW